MTIGFLYEVRFDRYGPIRVVAKEEKWLMVRRPYCRPFVVALADWQRLSPTELDIKDGSAISVSEFKS